MWYYDGTAPWPHVTAVCVSLKDAAVGNRVFVLDNRGVDERRTVRYFVTAMCVTTTATHGTAESGGVEKRG